MALELDGFATLAAIAADRELFADLAPDVDKAARALALKFLKRRKTDVAALRALRGALGAEALALLLDGFAQSEIVDLLARCDARHADASQARARLDALLEGRAEPSLAPAPRAPARERKAGLAYASAARVRPKSR